MRTKFWQRCMAMLLVALMTTTMLPVQAFAETTHDHEHEDEIVQMIEGEEEGKEGTEATAERTGPKWRPILMKCPWKKRR